MRFKILMMLERFVRWFDFSECYKESQGYNCQHRIYPSGFKECGEYPNYWKGDSDA